MISLNTPSDALQQLAAFIKKSRLHANITVLELALRSGIGTATLSRVEKNGACSTETMVRIFAALGSLGSFMDSLKLPEATTIADLRQAMQKPQRQRARRKS